MKIYGVAILAFCVLTGQLIGEILGNFLGIDGNIGGVGFAMLMLILLNNYVKRKNILNPETESGMLFWSSMYIPVVVAMSASQNVKAALSGGWVALLVGIFATAACYSLVPIIAKMAKNQKNK